MKAIETEYGGYRFRSRLEARWAIFFDACGVDWEYEPEGYVLSDGTKYLPDFLLHGVNGRAPTDLYVEVKGAMTADDANKILQFCRQSKDERCGEVKNPILVVGNIPEGEDIYEITDYCSNLGSDGLTNPALFNFETIDGDYFPAHPGINKKGGFELFGDDNNYLQDRDNDATLKAYTAARQARFEYGETPLRKEILRSAVADNAKEKRDKSDKDEALPGKCVEKPTIFGTQYKNEADARWAVFFEAAGIKYIYHPQGFKDEAPSLYPTFAIDINSGRDSGKIFVCVKSDINAQEYDAGQFDYSLVHCDYFESADNKEEVESEEVRNTRKLICKYYVPDISILHVRDIISLFEDATLLADKSYICNEPIMSFETLDFDDYPALLGIGENGNSQFYGPDWFDSCENKMSEEKTIVAYRCAKQIDISELSFVTELSITACKGYIRNIR